MIKEAKNGVSQELRIESFDENVQDIFNHTVEDYNKFKATKERPLNYVKQLNDYRFKFKKFYETAARSDKKLLKPYLDEISNLLDESEIVNKIKPIKKIDEGKLIDADALNVMMELIDLGYNSDVASKIIKKYNIFINQEWKDGAKPYWIAKLIEDDLVNHKFSDKDDEEELVKEAKEICEAAGKKVVNPENVDTIEDVEKELQELGYNEWQAKGLVKEYFKKAYRKLASGECAMNVAIDIDEEYMKESVDNELTKHFGNLKNWGVVEMNESFLSPGKLKKKLQRVATLWASIKGVKFEEAYNELRKKKSVKDMLDFYSVDEIIDDLSKNKKEVYDELEEEI